MLFWVILFGVILLISAFIAAFKRSGTILGAGAFIGFCVAVAGVVFGSLVGIGYSPDEIYETEKEEIFAITDNVGTSGQFYLGSGRVQSYMYYFYVTENDDGGKMMHQISSSFVPIYEDEQDNPYIVTYYKRVSDPVVRFFCITSESVCTEIHIPPKSIQYNFNVDLE